MGVQVESGKGGRRSVDAELNLIPFIDLLSVCILFLLMTAVWVQISKMSAFSQPSGENTVTHSDVASVNEARENRDWDIVVRKEGVQIVEEGKNVGMFKIDEARDQILKLKPRLKKPDAKIALRAADDVVYEDVIYVLDSLFAADLTNVTIGGI